MTAQPLAPPRYTRLRRVDFTVALMHKDVRLATKFGHDSATAMMLANVVRELFQTVIDEHGADKDTQTLVKPFERNGGVALAPSC
jgi:3-hydroxyisobutyrate dehydrogenase-like beta-hydroxyacid dehydrogenase